MQHMLKTACSNARAQPCTSSSRTQLRGSYRCILVRQKAIQPWGEAASCSHLPHKSLGQVARQQSWTSFPPKTNLAATSSCHSPSVALTTGPELQGPPKLLAAWGASSGASDQKGTCVPWWSKGQGSEQGCIYTSACQNVTTGGQGNRNSDIRAIVQILLWIRAGEERRIHKWNSQHWHRPPSRAVQMQFSLLADPQKWLRAPCSAGVGSGGLHNCSEILWT